MKYLPINKIKDISKLNEEQRKCVICFEYYKNKDIIMALPCFHCFHNDYITNWLNKKASCPLCNINININLNINNNDFVGI